MFKPASKRSRGRPQSAFEHSPQEFLVLALTSMLGMSNVENVRLTMTISLKWCSEDCLLVAYSRRFLIKLTGRWSKGPQNFWQG